MKLADQLNDRMDFDASPKSDVVVRGYITLGEVRGFGRVSVDACETAIPSKGLLSYFARVEIEGGEEYAQSDVVAVEYEKIQDAIDALQQLRDATLRTDRFAHSEIEYEINGLKFVVFNDARNRLMATVKIGNASALLNSPAELERVERLLSAAKSHIERHRVDG